MNIDKLGLLLQIIGIGLFTPIIFRWLLETIRSISVSFSSSLAKVLRKYPLVGELLAKVYLIAVDRMLEGKEIKQTSKLLIWSIGTSSITAISLIGFYGLITSNNEHLLWIPNWVYIVTWVIAAIFISDIIFSMIWDYGLSRTSFRKQLIEINKKYYFPGYVALNSTSKFSLFKKIWANTVFFFVYPFGGSILTFLNIGLIVGGLSKRFNSIANFIGILGWGTVLAGLILQYFSL